MSGFDLTIKNGELPNIPTEMSEGKMGWTMGLEPTTTGITTRGSTN